MNTNAIAGEVLTQLSLLHPRVTRNKSPQTSTNPYVVFTLDSSMPTDPSVDYYLNIDIFDDPNKSVAAIETLADSIQTTLDNKVINNSTLNIHFVLEQRQFVSNADLVTSQMINLRFVVRAYFL